MPSRDDLLERFLAEHGSLLRREAERVCPRRLGLEPDEIGQEARLRIWRALESEKGITHASSFIRRAVLSAAIDAFRQLKARREQPLPEKGLNGGSAEGRIGGREEGTAPSPEEELSRRETRRRIAAAVERIPESRRLAVRLYLRGFNHVEVGGLLDCSASRARNLIYRGLGDLRRELSREGIVLETR